jgi:hypothetical protein
MPTKPTSHKNQLCEPQQHGLDLSSRSAPSTPCYLTDLPAEIKTIIFELVFAGSTVVFRHPSYLDSRLSIRLPGEMQWSDHRNVLLTRKQCFYDGIDLYYKQTVLSVDCSRHGDYSLIARIPRHCRNSFRTLRMEDGKVIRLYLIDINHHLRKSFRSLKQLVLPNTEVAYTDAPGAKKISELIQSAAELRFERLGLYAIWKAAWKGLQVVQDVKFCVQGELEPIGGTGDIEDAKGDSYSVRFSTRTNAVVSNADLIQVSARILFEHGTQKLLSSEPPLRQAATVNDLINICLKVAAVLEEEIAPDKRAQVGPQQRVDSFSEVDALVMALDSTHENWMEV